MKTNNASLYVRQHTENCPYQVCFCIHTEGVQTCEETYQADAVKIPLDEELRK